MREEFKMLKQKQFKKKGLINDRPDIETIKKG